MSTKPFLMPIEGIHTIEGRGTVATGKDRARHHPRRSEVEIIGLGENLETVCTGIEAFNRALRTGRSGTERGLAAARHQGRASAARASDCRAALRFGHRRSSTRVYVLSKEEGGRHTPFFGGYKPQFFFRTTNVTGEVRLPADVEMVMPGDNARLAISLDKPIALTIGTAGFIREGGRPSARRDYRGG